MRQLSFGPEKTRQHEDAVRNPFLKLALLASLSIAAQPATSNTTQSKPATQAVAGRYQCSVPKVGGNPPRNARFLAPELVLSENNGVLAITDQTGVTTHVKRTSHGFTDNLKSGKVAVSGTGQFSADGTLRFKYINSSPRYNFTITYACKRVEPPKPPAPTGTTMRGVFIRPGIAANQFYNSFGGPGKSAVTVNGTLESSAQDLLNSGVTDIFVGFKTDFPWSVAGHAGDFIFDSAEGGYEDANSLSARQNDFDPIRAFMTACQNTYAAAGKNVRFHAWFPVFKDEYAVRFGFQTGNANSDLLGDIVDDISHIASGKDYDCQSNVAAEPSNPVVTRFELTALEELMAAYPLLSGINLDYIRYSLHTDPCYAGGDVKKDIEPHTWNVKPTAIEDFVKNVRAEFPNAVLSADVFADSGMRSEVGQAGILQYLNIIMPMAYTHDPNGTTADLKIWVSTIKQGYPTKTVIPILRGWNDGLPAMTPEGLISNLASDLATVKTIESDGYAVFTYEYLLKETGNSQLSAIKAKLGF